MLSKSSCNMKEVMSKFEDDEDEIDRIAKKFFKYLVNTKRRGNKLADSVEYSDDDEDKEKEKGRSHPLRRKGHLNINCPSIKRTKGSTRRKSSRMQFVHMLR